MKRSTLQFGVCLAAALMATTGTLSAQSLEPAQGMEHEYIVGGQVVSDDVALPGVAPDSYIGDMSMAEAGCADGSCDSCNDGSCGSCRTGLRGRAGKLGLGGMLGLSRKNSSGGVVNRSYGQPDLFYNYYTQGNANQVNAQMYMSPLPVPPNVGHTFNTYQPFYPHEMLYWHKDRFHNYYDNGRGMNRTRAVYYSPPVRQAVSNFYWNYFRLAR